MKFFRTSILINISPIETKIIKASREQFFAEPFPHLIVDEFFCDEFYNYLCLEIRERLALGTDENKPFRFRHLSRVPGYENKAYNLYLLGVPPKIHWPLSYMYSRQLQNLFKERFKLPLNNDVDCSFHHHPATGEAGWVHTDFERSNFRKNPLPNGLNPRGGDLIPLGHKYADPDVHQSYRALAIILYLNNETWERDHGGETALYASANGSPIKTVAPVNNRLLAFHVSPRSFHRSLANHKFPRNSLTLWYHLDPNVANAPFSI